MGYRPQVTSVTDACLLVQILTSPPSIALRQSNSVVTYSVTASLFESRGGVARRAVSIVTVSTRCPSAKRLPFRRRSPQDFFCFALGLIKETFGPLLYRPGR